MFITRPDVLKWCLNMHTFKTKEEEDLWGRSLLNVKKQWSGPFGERIIKEFYQVSGYKVYENVQIKGGFHPDIETDDFMVEVKTQTFFTTGTAGEKIIGVPIKYRNVPKLYGKKLIIVCVGGAEKDAKRLGLVGPDRDVEYEEFNRKRGISFVLFSDLLNNYLRGG